MPCDKSSRKCEKIPRDETKPACHVEVRMMEIIFKLVGIWITSKRLSIKEACLRNLGLVWLVLTLLALVATVFNMSNGCQQKRSSLQPVSITQMMRTALLVVDMVAHLYCFTLLRRYESNLVEFIRGSRVRCKYVRILRYLAVVSPILRAVVQTTHEWQNRNKAAMLDVVLQTAFSPIRMAYDLSMVVYLMAAVSLCDQVCCFKDRVSTHVKENGLVDLLWVCREAVAFKYSLRAKVSRINAVFSLPILVLYFKLFSYYLLFIYVGVVARSKQQRPLEVLIFIFCGLHSTFELLVLSSTTMFFIRKLREATDYITELTLNHEVRHLMLWSEVRRIVDFDSIRDAVMVWDSFVLCKATTVKFFVGMISCVSIILQFDVNFNNALDEIDQ